MGLKLVLLKRTKPPRNIILLTHLCQMNMSTSSLWTCPFLIEGVSDWILFVLCNIEIPLFNENSVDPDQTPRSANVL